MQQGSNKEEEDVSEKQSWYGKHLKVSDTLF